MKKSRNGLAWALRLCTKAALVLVLAVQSNATFAQTQRDQSNSSSSQSPDSSAQRARIGDFDATGWFPCAQYVDEPMSSCDFGVARSGVGNATVVVTLPDGTTRAIYFLRGIAIGADTTNVDGLVEFSAERELDLNLIRVGNERYEIADAVVSGG